ncbi:hypothetical protein U9M48_020724 [Paspalum notatum var. saurae]|uniref:Glucose-induced degradation protein 4 homolog n=1 Tax=Paspalum notatum var. saurae TaxID=547442 RepID=A0AAQ3TG44_PASNO
MPVRVVDTATPSSQPSPGQDANPGQPSPPSCSLLSAGRCFAGTQNVSSLQKDEAWKVNVRIHGCDLEQGYLCGTMEALNVPLADTPVVTFWEGEIVDAKNHTFFTGKWEASPEDDIRHWSKFPSFLPLLGQVETDGGKLLDLSSYPFIFMRWKEQYFVNVGVDCGLTIAGFYYVCFSCSDGSISGFYYDPNSSPFQKLELKCTNEKNSGFTFSSYELQRNFGRVWIIISLPCFDDACTENLACAVGLGAGEFCLGIASTNTSDALSESPAAVHAEPTPNPNPSPKFWEELCRAVPARQEMDLLGLS